MLLFFLHFAHALILLCPVSIGTLASVLCLDGIVCEAMVRVEGFAFSTSLGPDPNLDPEPAPVDVGAYSVLVQLTVIGASSEPSSPVPSSPSADPPWSARLELLGAELELELPKGVLGGYDAPSAVEELRIDFVLTL